MIKMHMLHLHDMNRKFKLQKNLYFSIKTDSNGCGKLCIFDKPLGTVEQQIDLNKDCVFSIIDNSKIKSIIKIPFLNTAIDYKEKNILQMATLQHFCTERYEEQIVEHFSLCNLNMGGKEDIYIEGEELEHVIHRIS